MRVPRGTIRDESRCNREWIALGSRRRALRRNHGRCRVPNRRMGAGWVGPELFRGAVLCMSRVNRESDFSTLACAGPIRTIPLSPPRHAGRFGR
jgi:hypothetical protein